MITSMMCSTMTSVTPMLVDPAHQRDRALHFGRRQPGERLVEQHQPRLRSPARARSPAACGRACRARARADRRRAQARSISSTSSACSRASARWGWRRNAPTIDVLEHRHVLEGRRHLEGAADAGARMHLRRGARDDRRRRTVTRAGGRHGIAGETIEEGRFAGAVRPDQADDLAFRDRKIGVAHARRSCRTPSRRSSASSSMARPPACGAMRCQNS